MQTSFKEKSDFFQRIEQIIDYKQIKSVNEFAVNYLGYKAPQKINRLKEPGTNPSFEIIVDIVNKFEELSAEWLLTGKGSMLKKEESFPHLSDDIKPHNDEVNWEKEYYKVLRDLNDCLKKNNELLEDKSHRAS